jgi:hypothetical protein
MTQAKDRPPVPCTQTATDKMLQHILDERRAAELSAARIADIAGIPHERHDAFCADTKNIIIFVHIRATSRTWVKTSRATEGKFKKIEAAMVALRNALGSLTNEEKKYLGIELWCVHRHLDPERWPFPGINERAAVINALRASDKASAYELRALAFASASLVNKNPNRRGKREDWTDTALRKLVVLLWRCAHEHGGRLSASCKENKGSGTMFKVLEELRLYFTRTPYGGGVIKSVLPAQLPAQTIANIVAAEHKKAKAGT